MPADLHVLAWVLNGQRRSLVVWSLVMLGISFMYVGIYPAMGAENMAQMTEGLPEAMIEAFNYQDIGTAAGYVGSSVYGILSPILLLVFGIGFGSRVIAGEEEAGTLELELTGPTPRRSIYLQRLAALWLDLALLVVVVGIGVVAMATAVDIDIPLGNVAQTTAVLLLLELALGTVALAVGAATGRRSLALGAATGVALVGYVFDAVGPTIDAGWMSAVSPFSWYMEENPVVHGADPVGMLLLAAVALAAAVAGLIRFERRDLMV